MVKVSLETGRTHQIRVHMAHIGHPVLGDPTYGAGFKSSERRLSPAQVEALTQLGRQALHAAVLGFEHPVTGDMLRFESSLPEEMATLAAALQGVPETKPAKRSRAKVSSNVRAPAKSDDDPVPTGPKPTVKSRPKGKASAARTG
jgi:hypothetical protein